VTETVVDDLEVVEIEEQHGHRCVLTRRAPQRLLDSIGEQQAIGEARQRVVEGLVAEVQIQLLAPGDVAHRQDDAVNLGSSAQVDGDDVEVAPPAIAVSNSPFDVRRCRAVRQDDPKAFLVRMSDQVGEQRPVQLC
jgi:hypothetical protein